MAEGAPLLREYAGKTCIEGSNPSGSAKRLPQSGHCPTCRTWRRAGRLGVLWVKMVAHGLSHASMGPFIADIDESKKPKEVALNEKSVA